MSKIYQVEFSNGVDTVQGAILPSASAAMEVFLQKYHHDWDDSPYGRIVDLTTGEVCAHYACEINDDLNLTNNLWASGNFIEILQIENAMDKWRKLPGGE